jgi:hypothetical protein
MGHTLGRALQGTITDPVSAACADRGEIGAVVASLAGSRSA